MSIREKMKEKMMGKVMDMIAGDFSPEKLIDLLFEKPMVVYAEIALFKSDTGKICLTINKLPPPQNIDTPEGANEVIEKLIRENASAVIMIPSETKPKTEEEGKT